MSSIQVAKQMGLGDDLCIWKIGGARFSQEIVSMENPEKKSIAKQFADTWKSMYISYGGSPETYPNIHIPANPAMLDLIRYLRGKGYPNHLRVGRQLFTFILSRARYNGLVYRQPHIRITHSEAEDCCFKVKFITPENEENFNVDDCENYREILRVVKQLLEYPIDEGEYPFLAQARFQSPDLTKDLLKHITIATEEVGREFIDNTEPLRTALIDLLYNYEMKQKDLPLVRHLLRQEVVYSERIWGVVGKNVSKLGEMISYFGSLDDLFFLWEMRNTTFDMKPSLDAAYFFGHEYDETLTFLKKSKHQDSQDIIEFLKQHAENEYTRKRRLKIRKQFSEKE